MERRATSGSRHSPKVPMEPILEQFFNGVSNASVLLLIALGLTFTFGQMGVINMAHGELIMVGAFTPYVLQTEVAMLAGATGLAFGLALPLSFLIAGVVGVAMERTIIRRMYDRPLDTLLVTFGISLLLQQAAKDIFGAPNVAVTVPTWLRGNWEPFGFTMPHTRLFLLVLALLTVAAIWAFMSVLPAGRR